MQEPHVEDVANHNDHESCRAHREVRFEALTGGNAGQPLSFVSYLLGADRVVLTGRHYRQPRYRDSGCRPNGVARPWHAWTFQTRDPGGLRGF